MENNWPEIQLSEFVFHQKGFAFKSKDYVSSGIPVVRVSNFTADSIDISDFKFVTRTVAEDKLMFELMENDVVIATVGSWPSNPASVVGKVIRVPINATPSLLNQNAVILRPIIDEQHDKIFLYYLLKNKSFSDYIVSTAQGSANQASITLKDIYAYRFPLPLKEERKAIAQTLKQLDDKITLNRQINQTLEQMAQALFKAWFVDFDPVVDNALDAGFFEQNLDLPDELLRRAEARQAARKQSDFKPLPDTTRQLFPAAFEACAEPSLGLGGWVPKGWEPLPVSTLIDLIGGGTPKTTEDSYWGGNIPWFSVVDAPNDSDIFVIDTEKKVTELGVENSSTKILRKGTTIISARGTVGKCAVVATPMAMNQSCYGIVGANGVHDYFIYYLIRQSVSQLQQRSHGSVFSTITRDTFKTFNFTFPGKMIANQFGEIIFPLFEKILSNNHQKNALAVLRDTLLPKLISGELRLDDLGADLTTE